MVSCVSVVALHALTGSVARFCLESRTASRRCVACSVASPASSVVLKGQKGLLEHRVSFISGRQARPLWVPPSALLAIELSVDETLSLGSGIFRERGLSPAVFGYIICRRRSDCGLLLFAARVFKFCCCDTAVRQC